MSGIYSALTGKSWSETSLTWSVASSATIDATLTQSYSGYPAFDANLTTTQESLVSQAFATWAGVSGLSFVKVADAATADIRIGLDDVDGAGGTLAQATYWTSGSGRITTAVVQFDTADLFNADLTTGTPASNTWSFLATAIHEIGHTLGLGHVNDTTSIMYPYASEQITLGATDVTNIQLLYGAPSTPVVSIDLTEEQTAAIEATTPASVVAGIDTSFYLSRNSDVRAAGMDAVTHYNAFGWREGRDPNSFFDSDAYLTTNTDVAAANMNPYEHYLNFGWREGRDASEIFDGDAYLAANPDVAAAVMNPLVHYLSFGILEGRDIA